MWQGIEGHDEVVELFRRAIARGRLASTYLFVGPEGVGKRTFARRLAQALLCRSPGSDPLEPCGRCEPCIQMVAGSHPDLLEVARPADRAEIPLRLLIGPPERRMQEGLCHDLWQKPLPGSRRIAIIDDADYLNEESANCLLKTLEEPPPKAVVFLIGTSAERQLPTILSRAQLIRFRPLEAAVVARRLLDSELVSDPAEAHRIASHCEGSLARARELLDQDYWQFRRSWLAQLAAPGDDPLTAPRVLLAFIEAAGKEATARRARARQIIDLTIDFYTELSRTLVGAAAGAAADVREAAERRASTGVAGEDAVLDCVERSLTARAQLDRYVNQATLVECWLDDLASAARGVVNAE
ncbi:MAG TPA: AAA family ATPase [Pirellulales bacterium]|jgi:DNA polymerase-3 subunit delta'|nr:AAA family ATPase [Pirellulales bacterium]